MEFLIKPFHALTAEELWRIYHARAQVFIMEQQCVYLDVDAHDKAAYHVMALDEAGQLQAYARVLPAGTVFDEPSIGRVLSLQRRCGLGTAIVQQAIQTAIEQFNAETLLIEAQVYAVPLYEKAGFRSFGDTFLEDGIPHVHMRWTR